MSGCRFVWFLTGAVRTIRRRGPAFRFGPPRAEVGMTAELLRIRPRLLLLVLAVLTGCHALRLAPLQPVERPPRPDPKEPAVAAPAKHSLRVSQYVFLSDFDLKPDLPLFKDLTDL